MAILREGMECRLCDRPMVKGQQILMFSPFVGNEADPLFIFNDGAFHTECFQKHPLAAAAEARNRQVREQNKPTNRVCVVCQSAISNPDDYFGLGYHTADPSHPLQRFNFTHIHRSCLKQWPDLSLVCELAGKQFETGAWRGKGMEWLVNTLKAAIMK